MARSWHWSGGSVGAYLGIVVHSTIQQVQRLCFSLPTRLGRATRRFQVCCKQSPLHSHTTAFRRQNFSSGMGLAWPNGSPKTTKLGPARVHHGQWRRVPSEVNGKVLSPIPQGPHVENGQTYGRRSTHPQTHSMVQRNVKLFAKFEPPLALIGGYLMQSPWNLCCPSPSRHSQLPWLRQRLLQTIRRRNRRTHLRTPAAVTRNPSFRVREGTHA